MPRLQGTQPVHRRHTHRGWDTPRPPTLPLLALALPLLPVVLRPLALGAYRGRPKVLPLVGVVPGQSSSSSRGQEQQQEVHQGAARQ